MQQYSNNITDAQGNAVPFASVTINTLADGVKASLFSDKAGTKPLDNPLTADALGRFSFFAANGSYTGTVSGTSVAPASVGTILLYDHDDDTVLNGKVNASELAASGGAALVGAASGKNAQQELDELHAAVTAAAAAATSATKSITNISAAYTVASADLGKIINCTGGTFTLSLTAAATLGAGFNCTVWNTSATTADTVTIDPAGSETVDGVATLKLQRGEGVELVVNAAATGWEVGGKKAMRCYAENLQANGTRPTASGSASLALMSFSQANSIFALAIGGIASGLYSVAIGGFASSQVQATAHYGVAIGTNSAGQGAQAVTGAGAVALGGSYASGTDSFAAAGADNTSTYGAQGANSIAMGKQNKASGAPSYVFGGTTNIASGAGATVLGGASSQATAVYSYALGLYALAAMYGKHAYASGAFGSVVGSAQTGRMVLRVQTADATATALTSDGAAASASNQIVLPNDSTFIFRGQVVARNTALDTDSKAWEFKGAIRRGTTAASTAIIGTPTIDVIASDGSTWTLALSADTTNGALAVTVTGEAAKTIRWVCTVSTTEVTG